MLVFYGDDVNAFILYVLPDVLRIECFSKVTKSFCVFWFDTGLDKSRGWSFEDFLRARKRAYEFTKSDCTKGAEVVDGNEIGFVRKERHNVFLIMKNHHRCCDGFMILLGSGFFEWLAQ